MLKAAAAVEFPGYIPSLIRCRVVCPRQKATEREGRKPARDAAKSAYDRTGTQRDRNGDAIPTGGP